MHMFPETNARWANETTVLWQTHWKLCTTLSTHFFSFVSLQALSHFKFRRTNSRQPMKPALFFLIFFFWLFANEWLGGFFFHCWLRTSPT